MKFFLVAGLVAMAAAGPIGYGKPSEEQGNTPKKPAPVHGSNGDKSTPAHGSSDKKDGSIDSITKSSPQLGDAGKVTDSLNIPGLAKTGKDSALPVDSITKSSPQIGDAGKKAADSALNIPGGLGKSGKDNHDTLLNAPVNSNLNHGAVANGNGMLGGSASGFAQDNAGASASSPSNGASKDSSTSPLINMPVTDNLNGAQVMNGNAVGSGEATKANTDAGAGSPSSDSSNTGSQKSGTLVNIPVLGNGNSANMLNGDSMLDGQAQSGSVNSPAKGGSSGSERTGTLVNPPIHDNLGSASLMNGNSMLGGKAAEAKNGDVVSSPVNGGASKNKNGAERTGTLINAPVQNNGAGAAMLNGNAVSSPIDGQSNKGINGVVGGSGNANGGVCSGNYIAQCCQLDVLGAAALTCKTPTSGLTSSQALVSDCASTGTTAQCCLLPVAGQALVCHDV